MSAFLASPVWGAVITVAGTAVIAIFGLIWRLTTKVDHLSDVVTELGKDIADMKSDANIVRWSDLRLTRARRRRRDI